MLLNLRLPLLNPLLRSLGRAYIITSITAKQHLKQLAVLMFPYTIISICAADPMTRLHGSYQLDGHVLLLLSEAAPANLFMRTFLIWKNT